jgi:hypothetical protein
MVMDLSTTAQIAVLDTYDYTVVVVIWMEPHAANGH